MGTTTDAATLRALYSPIGENPYDKRAAMIGRVMPESGFAKSLLAMAMGKEMSGAEAWDTATLKQAGIAAAQDYATKFLGHVIRVSENDPAAATAMLKVEAEQGDNVILRRYAGLKFSAKTEDGWATIPLSGDGKSYMVYLPGLNELLNDPNNPELRNKYVVAIGEGKPPAAEKEPKALTEYDNFIKTTITELAKTNPAAEGESEEAYRSRLNSLAIQAWDKKENTKTATPARARTESDVLGDITAVAGKIATHTGNTSLTEAIIRSTVKDPKILDQLDNRKDPVLSDLAAVLDRYKAEYKKLTGRDFRGRAAAPVAAPAPVSAKPPAGFVDSGRTSGGKKVYTKDNQAWIAP